MNKIGSKPLNCFFNKSIFQKKKVGMLLLIVLQRVIKYPGTRHVGTRPGPEFKRFGITRTRHGPGQKYPRVPESLERSNFLKKIYSLEQKCVNFLNSESSEKILPLKEKNNTKIKSFFPNFEHKNAKKISNGGHFHIFLII